MPYKIFEYDPLLKPFASDIQLRMDNYARKKRELLGDDGKLIDFANGHRYFGFHKTDKGWLLEQFLRHIGNPCNNTHVSQTHAELL